MDNILMLIKGLTDRITTLRREAVKLSRMANAATSDRERRSLREDSRYAKRKADLLEARLKELTKLIPEQGSINNG